MCLRIIVQSRSFNGEMVLEKEDGSEKEDEPEDKNEGYREEGEKVEAGVRRERALCYV